MCLLLLIASASAAVSQEAAEAEKGTGQAGQKAESYEYTETALRRFEIIFTVSLPFTVLHSYAVVRGIKMIQDGKVSPKFFKSDWRKVGIGAVGFSTFIGFWDWWHTHKDKISEPRIPQIKQISSSKIETNSESSMVYLEIARVEF